jgi:ElaB/YqjD/DUF883 family membrane-anchored ribosome-binding protein
MNAPSERDPENLERKADEIRADMDRTLDALERKLAPSQLLDRSLEYLRSHGGDMARTVGETVRSNPLPIAVAVAGIGWLVASTLRSRRDWEDTFDDTFGDESPHAQSSSVGGKVRAGVSAARERIRSSRAADKLSQAAEATREQTRRMQYQAMSVVDEHPILLGSIAVAVGALLGALIPATEYEDRTVGQVRDRAVERAKEMGERQYQNLRSRLETHRDLEVSGRAH